MVDGFGAWLARAGFAGYDPYDVWGTRYGLFARRVYYRHGRVGVPLVAPLVLLDIVCPSLRRLFVRKQRYATADAQMLLAFLNVHAVSGAAGALAQARRLADDLLEISIPGFSGHCWGYPFDWQHNAGLWRRDTPFITATPYAFEAFLRLGDVTGEARYHDVAASAAEFVFADLRDTPTGSDSAAGSYSPFDDSKVLNASAYRAFVLVEAAHRRPDIHPAYLDKASSNVAFILENQRADGAWLYQVHNPAAAFIDHFHTCFVLKNLYKLNERLNRGDVREAIERGYAYYRANLFDGTGRPRSFAIRPRLQLSRAELYDYAEAISLGVLLREAIPAAYGHALALAERVRSELLLPAGYFCTRIYRGGIRHRFPFPRWAQSQMFLALTNLLAAMETVR